MQKSQQFELDDGSILDVPEQERAAFDAEVQAKGRSVTPVQGFILDDGEPVHVPLNEVEEFKQTAQEKGRTFEAFTPIYAGGEFLDVPDSERSEFYRAYVKSEKPEIVKEREANTRKVIGDIVQDDEILTRWANRDKVSAGAANVFRAVPQAVASVPGYALKGGAFTTRFLDPILGEASKSMRDVVNGVADKLDTFAQEKFGFRDETGKLTGDLDVTAGPAALKSVVESYMLSKVPFAGVALSGKIAALVEPVLKSAKAADTVAKLAVPSVQSLLYGAAQAEDTAAKAEEAGKGTAQQIALGAATGTAQTVLENVTKIFGLQRVMGNKTLQETIQKAVLYAALDAVGEGVTEGAQQLSTGAIEKLAKIDAKTWGEIGKDALASTAVGLLAGGASASANLAALVAGGGAATRVQPSVQDAQQEPVEPQQEPVEPQQDAQEQQDAGDGQDAAAAAAATQGMELPEGVSLIGGDAPAVDVENGVRLIGAEENAQGEIVGARVQLPGGSVFTTIEPGILAMAQYYYKDNVLFPQPDGQQQPRAPEALAETVRIEASQRAGFNLRNGMTVDVYAGRSAKPYRADVVSILDGSTVRVKIRRSVRASKNNRAGYADVDIAQVKQLPSVKARLERTALEKDLTPEQKKIVNANEQAFRQLIQSDDTFIDQRKLDAARGIGGRRGAIMEKNVFDQAFFEASRALGVPLDNHIQRSEALGALQAFYAAREGAATQEAQQEQQSAQAVLESGRDWLRSAPDFQLDSMTIDEQKREQARLARQAEAERIRSVIADRMAAPIEGTAGVLNADLFGEGDTPLFFTPPQTQQPMPKSWEDAVRRGLVQDDTGDEAPFNVAPEQLDAMDRDYLAAVKRGDMDAAQKMVDAAAKLAGYTIGPVWHGTDGGVFTVFKPAKDGVFTTQNRASAEAYGQRVIKGFLKSDNMITLTPDVLADLDNEIGGFTEEDYRNNFASFYDSSNGFMRKRIVEIIRSKGYDGYIIPNDVHWTNKPESDVADAIVVFNAEQIKSADPVTRDDAGNVIPLSQRFDMRSEDIRFNVAPGGAATGEKSFYMREGAGETPAEDVDGISMMDSVSESPLGSVYGADSAGADDGSDATFVRDARSGRVFVGMDFRDAVKMYSDLTGGDLPKIVKQIARNPQAMGVFRAREGRTTGPIELVAALFGLVDNVDRERIAKEVEKDGFDSGEEFAEIERRMKALADERAKGKMKRPLKVMVHELSHMIDMMPDGVISRGNILGHIAALKKYRKFTVAAGLGMADEVTRAKKQELREQALKDVKELMGEARVIIEEIKREVPEYREIPVTPDALRGLVGISQDNLSPELVEWFARQDSAVKKEILKRALRGIVDERAARFAQRELVGVRTETVRTEKQVGGYTARDVSRRYAELVRQATEELRLIERQAIIGEAAKVFPQWRGTGVAEDYFMSQPNEMFAELYGMFLADPQWLRQNAPTTFRAFAGWLDARPEFARAYEAFARAKESGEQQAQHVINLREAMTVENENRLAALMHKMQEPTRQTAWQSIMFGFHRKMYPVYAAINSTYKQELEKAVTDAQRKDVRQQKLERIRAVKMTSHRAGAVNMLMSDLTGRVNRVLESINASWEMLGEMAFHQRNAYDVQGRVGVAWGWEPRDSMRRLEEMQADMGAERWAKMQDAWQYFRGAYEANVLDNPMVVKMYGREFVDSLRKNIWYVTFKHVPTRSEMDKLEEMIKKGDDRGVIDLMGDHVQNKFGSAGAKIYALKGSLKPVANPMIATMEKASSIIDSAVKNNLKLEFVKMAKINPGIKFWELKPLYDPGAKRPRFNEVNRANEGTVYYVDNGDLKAFVCDKYVAEAFNNSSETLQSIGWLMKFNRSMSAMYTSLNYAFYEPAYMKDKQAAVANVKGMYRAPVVGLLPFGEFIGLFNRYMSPEMQRLIPKPLLNDSMLEYHEPVARRAAIIIRDNSYDAVMEQATVLESQGNTVRADFFKRAVFLARYAQQNGLLMNMGDVVSGFDGTSDMSRLMRRKGLRALDYDSHRNMIGQMMDWVWGLGAIRENTTKLATLSFLKSKGYNDAEVTRIVTEWGGSPDFSERGFYTNVVEFVLGSFLNARKEAVLRSATAAADHPADYLTKKALYTVAPTILQWVLFSGAAKFVLDAMWDDDEKKDSALYSFVEWCYAKMRFAASYHMKNFMCLPLPVDGLGKCAVIMTIPLDETEQLVRNTIWSGLDEIAEKGFDVPAGKDKSPVKNLANSMFQSFIPALDVNAPLMKVVWMTLNGFVLGNNTTRSFNNSKVWNDDEMETRFSRPEAVTKLFKELWSVSGGAGMVYRDKVDPVLRDTLPLERAINLPFVQPYFGRFVRVVDSGIDEMESKLKALQESNRAPHQLQARADFARFVKEGANMSQDIQARIVDSPYYREEFEKLYATHYRDKAGVPFGSVRIEDPAILKRWESIVNLNRDLFEVRAPSENTRDSSILSILEPSRSVRLQTEK